MAVLAFPMAFKRQDAFSLDVDYWFKTKAELDAYLSSALRYTGQLAYCEETDTLYILSKDKTKWNKLNSSSSEKGIEIFNNYSLLPTVEEDTICYCLDDYVDTTANPNITYKKGFYLWHDDGINPTKWKLLSDNSSNIFTTTSPITNKIGQFDLDEEYSESDNITINEVLNKILHTNIDPEIEFEMVGTDTVLEIGQTIPLVKLRLSFTKVGNGNITNIQFYKNGVEFGTSETFIDGTNEYIKNDMNISNDTNYKVIVTYNFGKSDKTIKKEISCKFVKRSFYGTTADDSFVLNSDNIRALSGNKLALKKGDKININISSGDKEIIFAYPSSVGDVSSIIFKEGFNSEIKDSFTKQIVQVKDLGTTLSDYNVYFYKPVSPYSKDYTYVVTI